MHHSKIALLAIAFALLSGCESDLPVPSPNDPLVGCWFGEDFQPAYQRRASRIMNRRPDGTFTIEFSSTERGVTTPLGVEEGRWSHTDGKYTVRTLKVKGKEANYTDVYEVKSTNSGTFTYHHAKSKQTFTSEKVACAPSAPGV